MHVHLLAFASAGDALGANQLDLDLPDGSDVAALVARLAAAYPRLSPLLPRLAIAVDGELAESGQILGDGAEVALLPPVSGGASTGPAVARLVLVDGPLDFAAAVAAVSAPSRGAVVVFLGTVRDHHGSRAIEKLTYDAYRPMALAALTRIVMEIETGAADLRVAIHHRLGEVPAGIASVVIAVASPHRAEAYAASRLALERLKAEVPIWKREHGADGLVVWREEEPLVRSGDR